MRSKWEKIKQTENVKVERVTDENGNKLYYIVIEGFDCGYYDDLHEGMQWIRYCLDYIQKYGDHTYFFEIVSEDYDNTYVTDIPTQKDAERILNEMISKNPELKDLNLEIIETTLG